MKRELLVVVSMSIAAQAMAATSSRTATVKSAPASKNEAEKNTQQDYSLEAGDAIRAKNMAKTLSESALYKLDESTLKGIGEAYVKNKGVEEALKSINTQGKYASNDAQIRSINELRLKLMSYLGGIDPYNIVTVRESVTSPKKSAELDLATLVMTITPIALTNKAKENLIEFLKETETAIKDGSALSDAMKIANDILVMSKGVEIPLDKIQEAAQHTGVAELFKTDEDIRTVDIKGPGNSVALQVRMSAKMKNEIEALANEKAIMYVEMAKNPEISKLFADKGVKELRSEVNEVNVFMKDNRLLDRQSSSKTKADADRVSNSVDELLANLSELDAVVGGKKPLQNIARFFRKIPLLDKVIKDPAIWKRTLRDKILEIDGILADGVLSLDANNQVLNNIKAEALKRKGELQITMARAKFEADAVAHYADQLEARGDVETASILRSEVGLRIEGELDAALVLFAVFSGAIDGITTQVRTNHAIMTSGINLRTIATPAIAVTESLRESANDSRKIVAQNKQVSQLLERQMVQLLEETKRVNEEFAKQAGKSTISHVILEKVLSGLAQEKIDHQKRMEAAYKESRANNEKNIAVVNKTNASTRQDSLGAAIDTMSNPKIKGK